MFFGICYFLWGNYLSIIQAITVGSIHPDAFIWCIFCGIDSFVFGLLHFSKHPDYLILFYIRRFLIQPLFFFYLSQHFYYQK